MERERTRTSNPKGIVSSRLGLRAASYPGLASVRFSTPTGLCRRSATGPPSLGLADTTRFPRVARGSQPWASGRNPFWILGIDPPHPGGMADNSPTFQRWGRGLRGEQVPKGRRKSGAFRQPSLRDLACRGRWFPTLKRWAIVGCRSGTTPLARLCGPRWDQKLAALDENSGAPINSRCARNAAAQDRFLLGGRPALIKTPLQRGGCGTRTSPVTAAAV